MHLLPLEIINYILSFVERPATNKIIKYVINDCYMEDYDPYYAEDWRDNFCYQYSFQEWYFLYRKSYKKNNKHKYKHTPKISLYAFNNNILFY